MSLISYFLIELCFKLSKGKKLFKPRPQALAKALLDFLEGPEFETHNLKNISLPVDYKFYSSLIYRLLESAHKCGTPLLSPLKVLRKALYEDYKFEVKNAEILSGAWAQMAIIAFIGWGFLFMAAKLTGITPTGTVVLLILCLQFCGVMVFGTLSAKIKKALFSDYEQLYQLVYSHKMCAFTFQLPSEQGEGLKLTRSRLLNVKKRIHRLEQAIKSGGHGISAIIDEIVDELHFLHGADNEVFLKRLMALKMAIVLFFFVPSFFINLYSLISQTAGF
ncbi:MAG: hypothetical protein HOE90_06400 [Bacteriovoracaceae bacterium]|nr:hypothetical protein [Bacteriovoracaceae bacterium]